MIIIESKKKKAESILRSYPGAIVCDVTSKARDGLVKLSPFYPHGDIPVPFSEGWTAVCVEAVWQGLKVFEHADIDTALFRNDTMRNIKRTSRRFGRPLGHRKGVGGSELLGYIEARQQIYIPTYRWMLEHKVMNIIERLRRAAKEKTIVLLDYNTNCDVDDPTKPLSHAYLVKAYAEGLYPYNDVKTVAGDDSAQASSVDRHGEEQPRRKSAAKKRGRGGRRDDGAVQPDLFDDNNLTT